LCFRHPDHGRGQDADILSNNDSLLRRCGSIRPHPPETARDARLLAFFAALLVLTYIQQIPGIVPDMRYLSPTSRSSSRPACSGIQCAIATHFRGGIPAREDHRAAT